MTMLLTTLATAAAGSSAAAGAGTFAAMASGVSGLAAGSGAGLSIGSLLTNGLSFASAGLSLFGSMQESDAILEDVRAQARALEFQSREDEQEARMAEIQGQQEANDVLENLNQVLASQRLAFAANGIDPSFGTPQSVSEQTRRQAELQLATSRDNTRIRALSRRRQGAERLIGASNLYIRGQSEAATARRTGLIKGATTGADIFIRRANRG